MHTQPPSKHHRAHGVVGHMSELVGRAVMVGVVEEEEEEGVKDEESTEQSTRSGEV